MADGNGCSGLRVAVLHSPDDAESVSYTKLTLPDPKTGQGRTYLLSSGGQILEINQHKRLFSAWLAGDFLLSDGSLYVATPIDIVFLLLPLIENAEKAVLHKFCPIEQLLSCEIYNDVHLIVSQATLALECICDSKIVAGETYYKPNSDKVLAWMVCKAEQVADALPQQQVSVASDAGPSPQLRYATGFLGEYLSDNNIRRLLEQCGCSTAVAHTNSCQTFHENQEPLEKRQKLDPVGAQPKPDLKAARLAKSAVGTKKLSSFFGKKD